MHALTTGQAQRDLTDRADVEPLLRRFYALALVDDVLTEPFTELRLKGLESHLPADMR